MAAEEAQQEQQPEAERQGSPDDSSMEASSCGDESRDQEKVEWEKRKEARVRPPAFLIRH